MFVKTALHSGAWRVRAAMTNYPYVDIAVLENIRRPFAAGDALVIVDRELSAVIWANGSGLELFGLGRLDAALNGEVVLDDIQRRQIAGNVPSSNAESMVHLRFVQGPQTVLLPVHVSLILLPDGVEAVLLRIPFRSLKSRTQTGDTLDAIRNAGSHAAFIRPGARLVAGAEDIASLNIDPDDLARMMREVAGENDRLVKRQLRTAKGDMPAALARLTDEDGLHLLVVIDPVETETATDLQSDEADALVEQPVLTLSDEETTDSVPSEYEHSTSMESADQKDVFAAANEPDIQDSQLVAEAIDSDSLAKEVAANPLEPGPIRFAWKTNASGRFVEISEPFLSSVNMSGENVLGKTFAELIKEFGIIDEAKVADLFDKQGTWSGRKILWPVQNTDTAIPVELAGLPVFSRDRTFEGFRGFGVARPENAVIISSEEQHDQLEVPIVDNVVPFGRRTVAPAASLPGLDDSERDAFAEIGARLREDVGSVNPASAAPLQVDDELSLSESLIPVETGTTSAIAGQSQDNASIFSKLPLPVLVYSGEALHFANTAFLELSGYASLAAINNAGGLDALFGDDGESPEDESATGMHLTRADGEEISVNAHLQSVPWGEGKALMLAVARRNGAAPDVALAATQIAHSETAPEMAAAQQQIEELTAILDTATDGVVVLDAKGNIRSLNNAAQALFGYEESEIAGQPLNTLLAIESHRAANDYMSGLIENGVASVLNDGRDMIGREREGRFVPIFVNIARLSSSDGFCAVIRDVTNWKRAEEQLTVARKDAESASTNKSEFLARMSHEIRTPLNAIIGFSDVMINESFGPLGNERYKEYLQDIHRSGNLVLSLVNDLLDISKIEAGGQSFDFRAIELNSVVQEAVGMMQVQASRERVLIRTSYGYDLPQLVADERSIKQIVLNLVSNAIRFTDAGGQVIVSTNYEPNGDLTLKVRDTGIGMNDGELEDALRPYRQVGQKQDSETSGTGLGLPLARALAESNKGDFRIRSTPGEGTVIEIAFPASRVLAG